MSTTFDNFTREEWERFCERMLRQRFGNKHFTPVPDQDDGDLGIEFFTSEGTIFQCYFPVPGISMAEYKKRIKKKINEDLNKLKKYESEIHELLDGVEIHQWVLMTPEDRSRSLINYCNKKKKETINKNLSFIDNKRFKVKIETAECYSQEKLFALNVHSQSVNFPLHEVTQQEESDWINLNSEFSKNIQRKSNALMGKHSEDFQSTVIKRYIQNVKFLDQLKDEHPDIHSLVEDSALSQLQEMEDQKFFKSKFDSDFVEKILKDNKLKFKKLDQHLSERNQQSLDFGYLSKWLAECYLDFVNEE